LAAADCVRVGDDLAKFHLQLARLHKPVFGLHGSFLLAKGSLEDEITWDLQGSLVEDYAFALECMRRGYGVGEINGIVREQSPKSVMDFLRQRRRWLVGFRGLSRLSPWARLWGVLWSASPLVKMATVADVVLARNLSLPLAAVGSLFASTFLYLYLVGSVLQDLDCGTRPRTLVKRAFTTALFFPLSYALESVAVLWAFVSRERCIGFQTIRK
jgi:cellulose synthase/poly-beta-1,6-N-acetylglucosamine synthase-like glycosyltransferase